ncbi:hypothetical protein KJ762_14030, partial [bacterium]|nr:hypothetical protein [bacterium]MBU1635608.1 hypothetical protein [bacterium]
MLKYMINPCLSPRCIGGNLSGKNSSLVLEIMLILGLAMSTILMAANQVVTTNADDGGGELTTLREAIAAVGAGEEITFDADYTITLSSELTISKSLTITGTGAGSTIVQASASKNTATHRVFQIESGNTVVIENLTVRYGNITTSEQGAGISNQGTLTLTGCAISDNV